MPSNEYMRQYMASRRNERRLAFIEKLGGKCVRCGSTDQLEFDHVDPSTKSFTICTNLDRPYTELAAELTKCQLLCDPCHVDKTAEDMLPPHGTTSRYNHRKFPCKCIECKRVYNEWHRTYRRRKSIETENV